MRSPRWLLLALLLTLPSLHAQDCKRPASPPRSADNIFTPDQAVEAGNIITEQIGHDLLVVNNEALTAELQRIGDRLIKQVSPDVPVRFALSDLPVANAFTFPGGRVYITRKLIAQTRSEDELASVMGHELGHVMAHDPEVSLSREFQQVLGVTHVNTQSDMLRFYNDLIDNFARNPGSASHKEGKAELAADQLGVYALAAAGYDPQAFPQFWDRLTENKSAKGSWFTNLFGTTRPDAQRFREAVKNAAALPAGCVHKTPSDAKQYEAWRALVVRNETPSSDEKLSGVMRKVKLDPPLRPDLTQVRFSPDGKWVLAQDETSIYVISRDPLAFKFRIDARDALDAQFTPDSRSIVFHNPDLRIEQWDVAEQKQTLVQEISVPDGCFQSELAPDGKTLACVRTDFDTADFRLIDVASGDTVFEKRRFYTFDYDDSWALAILVEEKELAELAGVNFRMSLFQTGFTPDAHYFVVARGITHLAVDVTQRTPVNVGSAVAHVLSGGFAFYGTQRILGINALDPRKSALVSFPSGEKVATYNITPRQLQAPAHDDQYVIVRPAGQHPVGLVDLAKQQVQVVSDTPAFDIYDDIFAAERKDGGLEFYRMPSQQSVGRVPLPEAPLGRLRAGSLSPDFNTLAISEASRGGVWNLEDGKLVQMLMGFQGSYLSADGGLYAEFPKQKGNPEALVRLGLKQPGVIPMFEMEETKSKLDKTDPGDPEPSRTLPKSRVQLKGLGMDLSGPFVLAMKPAKEDDPLKNVQFTAYNTTSGSELWTQRFADLLAIRFASEQFLVYKSEASDKASQEAINEIPALRAQLKSFPEKKGIALLDFVALSNGESSGKLLVDTGKHSFGLESVEAAGDYVVLADNHNRTLVYRLSSGAEVGSVFGNRSTLSAASNLLLVENNPGETKLYSLPSMAKVEELNFGSRLHFARFSADGNRLFVLTEKQQAYLLDVSGKPESSVAEKR